MSASPRAVIYARYSTELQHDKSVEDQIDLCRTYGEREGMTIVREFFDKAKSGASMHNRDGLLKMIDFAMGGGCEVIIVEDLDRLSRDMEDMSGMFKRLQFMGIRLIEVHGGEANTLTVAMKAIFAQMVREVNVHKIRRGMTGLVKQGLSAGGKPYGYRPDPLNTGKLIIVEEEAEVVREVFAAFIRGESPRAIARRLNARRVPGPRSKHWKPTALIGSAKRGSGLLRNPIYAGRPTWNKVSMVKDPSTGKRVSRPNPREEWISFHAPDLRIISDDVFEAAQAQIAARAHGQREENIGIHRRPQHLLSGLIKCGTCGAGMSVYGHTKRTKRVRIRCSAHKNSGVCPDPKTYYLDEIEEVAIYDIAKQLSHPEQIMACAQAYIEARRNETAEPDRRRAQIGMDLKKIAQKLERINLMLIDEEGDKTTLEALSKELAEQRDELEQERDSLPVGSNVSLHPTAFRALGDRVKRLTDKWASSRAQFEYGLRVMDDMKELGPVIRELIHSIHVNRDEHDRMQLRIVGYLQPFIKEGGLAPRKVSPSGGAVSLVAEEGLEPPTRGL